MAKKFFYVCAGLFLLALSYHLGATAAVSQGIGMDAGGVAHGESTPSAAAVVNGMIWARNATGPTVGPFPLPKPGHVIAVEGWPGGSSGGVETAVCSVLYDDGDFYTGRPPLGWDYGGNVLNGTGTAAARATWGQVKSTYRK